MTVTEYWFVCFPLWRIVMNLKCKCRQMFKMVNMRENSYLHYWGLFYYYFKNFQQRMLKLLITELTAADQGRK